MTNAQAPGAQSIGWQEAVARLAAERTRAETCAALLKKYGDAAAIDRGALAYGEAKAEVDGIVAGLVVALARGDTPISLPDLEARLERAEAARVALYTEVIPLVPPATGEKNLIIDLMNRTLGPLIEAVTALWLNAREADRLTRQTIQTQLEATIWRAFSVIAPMT